MKSMLPLQRFAKVPTLSFDPNPTIQPETLMDDLHDRLELDSRLDELGRVFPWIEATANRFGLPEEKRFALHLCMEEALANVVLHGYRNEPGHRIFVRSAFAEGRLLFIIEDSTPPFELSEDVPPIDTTQYSGIESIEPGGNGIRLLRHFAGSISYERTAHGNRLTIAFPISQ